MEKSESIVNITKAICEVMQEVKGIDKNMTIGEGKNSYKGVKDQDVKKLIGESMAKNGLCILPIEVDSKLDITKWEESTQYGVKQKQSIFSEVKTKYILMHDSGEYIVIAGAGHGVDSQDKGIGKATTYALKNALLYSFMVPTGKIDDADSTHSDEYETPIKQQNNAKEFLNNAIKEVNEATTEEILLPLWTKFKDLTTITEFKTAFNNKRAAFYSISKKLIECAGSRENLNKIVDTLPEAHKTYFQKTIEDLKTKLK